MTLFCPWIEDWELSSIHFPVSRNVGTTLMKLFVAFIGKMGLAIFSEIVFNLH